MPDIFVLDSSVFNRIAAGEVVEKPLSVVKELLENSIDSGATSITVRVKEGGKYIFIKDNGCGIAEEDIRTAFLPHATSKIRSLKDLDSISTLGFRGEALPSIASVAKVTLISRKAESEMGHKIVIENGKELSFSEEGSAKGTTIIVENLFANVPARLKFLRSDRSEENDITALMQRMIMANYNLAITYEVNGKTVFSSDGSGLEHAIYTVYGSDFLKQMRCVKSSIYDIELYGYVNTPTFPKHNKSYQTLILNGRYVNNSDISFWIYNCYSEYLMKRQYPAYVLFLKIPEDMVDINVHPSKMEVKFVSFEPIRKLLSSAIKEAFQNTAQEPKDIFLDVKSDNCINKEIYDINPNTQANNEGIKQQYTSNPFMLRDSGTYNSYNLSGINVDEKKFSDASNNSTSFASSSFSYPDVSQESVDDKVTEEKPRQFELFHDIVSGKSGLDNNIEANSAFYSNLNIEAYVGQLFNTYLIFEINNELILIDQHAAHEKLLYKKFMNALEQNDNPVQDLLFPYIFDVDYNELCLIEDNMEYLQSIGFTINRMSGNSLSLSSVPLVLSKIELQEFVRELPTVLKKGRISKSSFMLEELAQCACKAAVKGNNALSSDEVKELIEQLIENKIELFCPHGRPIAIKLAKSEIEKWFKRIV